jgi:hypothetical protein
MSAGAVPAALPTTSTTPETTRMLAVAQVHTYLSITFIYSNNI